MSQAARTVSIEVLESAYLALRERFENPSERVQAASAAILRATRPSFTVIEGLFQMGEHTITVKRTAFACDCQEYRTMGLCETSARFWLSLGKARGHS